MSHSSCTLTTIMGEDKEVSLDEDLQVIREFAGDIEHTVTALLDNIDQAFALVMSQLHIEKAEASSTSTADHNKP